MYWDWFKGGCALGVCFLLTVIFVKPIGVSTQFVILDGIVANLFSATLVVKDDNSKSGYSSSNAYLDKSGGKYAKSVAKPLNYSFVFVLSMILGGYMGRLLQNKGSGNSIKQIPDYHRHRFGDKPAIRYSIAFAGGIIVLWGARLAGGCTSGHMMSGMMQTAVSGYVFAIAAFIIAVPTAIILYRK